MHFMIINSMISVIAYVSKSAFGKLLFQYDLNQ